MPSYSFQVQRWEGSFWEKEPNDKASEAKKNPIFLEERKEGYLHPKKDRDGFWLKLPRRDRYFLIVEWKGECPLEIDIRDSYGFSLEKISFSFSREIELEPEGFIFLFCKKGVSSSFEKRKYALQIRQKR